MRNLFLFLICISSSLLVTAQELNATVSVVANLTGNNNNVVFKTLERQLTEFINNTQWTDKAFKLQERINCSFVINVQNYENDNFAAALQVQSSRPVYASTFSTPVYTFNDTNFQFKYIEFQNMVYNENQFESNLISVIAFHIYMILGMDADSFEKNGGDLYYRQAQTIANYSQRGNALGWRLEDGLQTRFAIIDNILSPTYKEFRTALYGYHRQGLDRMHNNVQESKKQISTVIKGFLPMHSRRPNSFLMRVFFDSKANEISELFSGGPKINITNTVDILNRIATLHSQKWNNIKY